MVDIWMTVEEVAEKLQVHPDSVRRWLRAGELRGYMISRKAGYRIRPDDVDEFVMRDRGNLEGKLAA